MEKIKKVVNTVVTVVVVATAKVTIARTQNKHLSESVFFDAWDLQKEHALPLSQNFQN